MVKLSVRSTSILKLGEGVSTVLLFGREEDVGELSTSHFITFIEADK